MIALLYILAAFVGFVALGPIGAAAAIVIVWLVIKVKRLSPPSK